MPSAYHYIEQLCRQRAKVIKRIKYLCVAGLAGLFCVSHTYAAEREVHLFILSGQSNMAKLDPEISFTPAVEAALGKNNVIVIKDAMDSQPIRRWYKKWKAEEDEDPKEYGDLYDRLLAKVKDATMGVSVKSVTFIWMQGERDAGESHGDVYGASLLGLMDQLRTDLGRSDVNFVIGRISDFGNNNKRYPHWAKVREAQVEVAEVNMRDAWVDTDDLNGSENDIHYTQAGYKELGKRFAEKAILLIRAVPKNIGRDGHNVKDVKP